MKNKTLILLKDSLLSTFFSFLLIYVLTFIVINLSIFDPFKKALTDFSFLDVYYAENLNFEEKINPDIIIINVEQSNRTKISALLSSVKSQEPSVIGLDVIFKGKKEVKSDSILSKTLNDPRIVSGFLVQSDGQYQFSHPQFNHSKPKGFVNFNFDNQTKVIRSFETIHNKKDSSSYSFAYQVAKAHLKDKWNQHNFEDKLNHARTIKYQGNHERFLNFSIDEYLNLSDKSVINNKIVLIGYLGTPTGNINDIEDKLFTPLNSVSAGKSIPDMYGVTIHANIISMIITNDFMFRVSNFWTGVWTFLLVFIFISYFIKLDNKYGLSFATRKKLILFVFTVLMVGLALLLFKFGIVLKVLPIIGVVILCTRYHRYYKHCSLLLSEKTRWKSYIK